MHTWLQNGVKYYHKHIFIIEYLLKYIQRRVFFYGI